MGEKGLGLQGIELELLFPEETYSVFVLYRAASLSWDPIIFILLDLLGMCKAKRNHYMRPIN